MYSAVWFCLIQGLWFGLISFSVFTLISNTDRNKNGYSIAVVLLISINAAFNGISLATIGFPHFEVAIPALIMAFFAMYFHGKKIFAYSFLFLGLLMREDAGLHYFGVFFILACYSRFFLKHLNAKQYFLFFGKLAAICFTYGMLALVMQKFLFFAGDNALSRVYLGTPAFQHLDFAFFKQRFEFIFGNRMYIFAPLLISFYFAFAKKEWVLLIGTIAVTPWIIFSILALSFQAGTLTSYYAFPIIIGILWPAAAFKFKTFTETASRLPSPTSSLTVPAIIIASSIVFFVATKGNHDAKPWEKFGPDWMGKVVSNQTALDQFFKQNGSKKLIVDDAVASLESKIVTNKNWKYELGFDNNDLQTMDAIVFKNYSRLTPKINEIINQSGFSIICQIDDSDYLFAQKNNGVFACNSKVITANMDGVTDSILMAASTTFNYYQGWSRSENSGRWTISEKVIFPLLKIKANNEICLQAHGFLPTKDSKIDVDVFIAPDATFIGHIVFSNENTDGLRCLKIAEAAIKGRESVQFELKVQGFSSPKDNGLSSDDRPIGIFVESIKVKDTVSH